MGTLAAQEIGLQRNPLCMPALPMLAETLGALIDPHERIGGAMGFRRAPTSINILVANNDKGQAKDKGVDVSTPARAVATVPTVSPTGASTPTSFFVRHARCKRPLQGSQDHPQG